MATHERELTGDVDLCTPDGRLLNEAARGWSRRPLHRANLGPHPQNKRWDYWAILAGDVVVSATVADVESFGLADVWWVDLATERSGGAGHLGAREQFRLPERPGTAPIEVEADGFRLAMVDDERGTRITADWHEPDGEVGHLDVLAQPGG